MRYRQAIDRGVPRENGRTGGRSCRGANAVERRRAAAAGKVAVYGVEAGNDAPISADGIATAERLRQSFLIESEEAIVLVLYNSSSFTIRTAVIDRRYSLL
jgi:hypothetical protein